jgi:hypothetical protein
MRTGVHCNECYEMLTEEELSVYDLQWQHSGDMYCMSCRNCADDCRRTPCKLDTELLEAIKQKVKGLTNGKA